MVKSALSNSNEAIRQVLVDFLNMTSLTDSFKRTIKFWKTEVVESGAHNSRGKILWNYIEDLYFY